MDFLSWKPLIWLLVIIATALALRWSLVDRPSGKRLSALVFRLLGMLFLVLALCRPFWTGERNAVHIAFLLDVSESVDVASMKKGVAQVRSSIEELQPGDDYSLFLFGSALRPVSLEEADAFVAECEQGRGEAELRAETDLEEALLQARLTLPADKGKRLVVLTDGLLPMDPSGVLDQLEKEDTDVRVVKLDALNQPEAALISLIPESPSAFQGEITRLKVKVGSNRDMNARLKILHRGVVVAEKVLELKEGEVLKESVEVELVTSGDSVWEAQLEPENDYFPDNNKAATTIEVRGEPRVLVIHEKPQQMRPAARALREQGIELEVRGTRGLPDSLRGMLGFDAIILADVPATALEYDQMKWLKQYVTDFGGGLIMTGSENSFGLGGYFKTPVEDVLPLVSRFEKEKQKPSLAMILVIDKSGSMSGNPIVLARQAARAAAELLSPQDQIAVIGFDSNPQLVLDLTSASQQGQIATAIDSIAAGGGTNLAPAMMQANEILRGAHAKIKHVIAMTDGQTPAANLLDICQEMADSGMTVSTVAMGRGASRELLASMAEAGRGRYYETDSPENVPQIFTKETMQASRSAIKEDLYAVVPVAEHAMLTGFESSEMPMVLGYVMTRMKPTAQMLLAAESGDPLLASGQFGLGTGVAFTSDLTERWASEWLAWDRFGPFWAQVIRGALKTNDSVGLSAIGRVERGMWHVSLRRVDEAGRPVHGVEWDAMSFQDDEEGINVAVREIGLGRYELSVPLNGERMALRLADPVHGKMKTLQWNRDYPNEYRLSSTYASSLTDSRTLEAGKLRDGIGPVVVRSSAIPHFGFLAIASLLLGLICRRI
jgi:Ca-activated chloride channel family protein